MEERAGGTESSQGTEKIIEFPRRCNVFIAELLGRPTGGRSTKGFAITDLEMPSLPISSKRRTLGSHPMRSQKAAGV